MADDKASLARQTKPIPVHVASPTASKGRALRLHKSVPEAAGHWKPKKLCNCDVQARDCCIITNRQPRTQC